MNWLPTLVFRGVSLTLVSTLAKILQANGITIIMDQSPFG